MGETTGIGWTDHTHNEWEGCLKISPACTSCYAEVSTPVRVLRAKGLEVWGPAKTTPRHRTSEANRRRPFAWDRAAKAEGVRRRVFCSSLSDVFEDHPMLDAWRADLWRTIEACDGLDWQLLTKRPQNILAMVPAHWRTAWPAHIWIGTTVEDQRRAEERIPHLLRVPARVRFLSCEPLLERIDLAPWLFVDGEDDWCGCGRGARAIIGDGFHRCAACGVTEPAEGSALSWVIVGGESGPGARPFDLAWARSILRQCAEAGVACFVKQLGACASDPINGLAGVSLRVSSEAAPTIATRLRDRAGADSSEWPADLRVQQFPGGGGASTGIEAAWGQDPDSALRTEATIDSLLARALLIRGRA